VKSLLVTGGAGFIGSNYIHYVLQADPQVHVVNLDALTYAASLDSLAGLPDPTRHVFVQGDVCDQQLVADLIREHEIDAVVHFAAESHVDRSILGPAPFVQTNIVGTFSLLEAARQAWLASFGSERDRLRFHHVSTDEVYGSLEPEEPAFAETTPYSPHSPYAASKASSDHLVRAYAHTYGLPVVITNCSNNYGPRQFPEKLVPLVILNALEGKPLPVYGDGQQVRDWLYVEDHCEALWTVLQRGALGETYNIGGGAQVTNLSLVTRVCEILDELVPDAASRPHLSLVQFVEDRPGHDRRYAMNISKIVAELGWRPRYSLQDGLRSTVQWYLEHRDWVAAMRRRDSYQTWIAENYAPRRQATP
jgi:dTDP-glucose 4,6-dehydratase